MVFTFPYLNTMSGVKMAATHSSRQKMADRASGMCPPVKHLTVPSTNQTCSGKDITRNVRTYTAGSITHQLSLSSPSSQTTHTHAHAHTHTRAHIHTCTHTHMHTHTHSLTVMHKHTYRVNCSTFISQPWTVEDGG